MEPATTRQLTIVSLFDGIGNSYIASQRANLNTKNYFSCEIEKNAIKVVDHHYSNDQKFKKIGNVRNVRGTDFPDDGTDILVIYSFPCLDLSAIKKNRQGLSGPESSLFFESLRILKELKEMDRLSGSSRKIYHLGENVSSMRNEDRRRIISNLRGIFPDTYSIDIDSQLVSASHRRRAYFTNIQGVQQPEQLGIKLSDIIENGYVDREKSRVILTSNITMYKSSLPRHYNFGIGTVIFKDKEFSERPVEEKLALFPMMLEQSGYKGKPNKNNSPLDFPNSVFRLPTVSEYCKLMTLPPTYLDIDGISTTSKVSLIGLSITVDVVKHIMSYLPEELKVNENEYQKS
ncbi:MAG: DNA cytosine methyltransferase [Flavobacteriia bacterium]|nr:DNA cytosine methyltransferase [Flavobacteriia bacterium]OJX39608.1 MAG: hypothetical protein BGO87_11760 [Flavobacteriia bacterium 40-80]